MHIFEYSIQLYAYVFLVSDLILSFDFEYFCPREEITCDRSFGGQNRCMYYIFDIEVHEKDKQ